jgi:hypothetical protein
MKTTDEFDEILSNALSEYRKAEPLAGLEDRVLRRVQQQRERRKLWWRWSFAAGLAMALLAVAAWIELRDPPYRPLIDQTTVQQMTSVLQKDKNLAGLDKPKPDYPETVPNGIFGRSNREEPPARAAYTVAKRPIRGKFPVPTPLTSEERALLALARTNPEALQTLPRNDEALAIAPITIQPLTSTGGDQGDN